MSNAFNYINQEVWEVKLLILAILYQVLIEILWVEYRKCLLQQEHT